MRSRVAASRAYDHRGARIVRDLNAILVTGAGGQIGGPLVEELVCRGALTRAMVRTEERVNGLAARGVDAVVGDFERPGSLPRPRRRGPSGRACP